MNFLRFIRVLIVFVFLLMAKNYCCAQKISKESIALFPLQSENTRKMIGLLKLVEQNKIFIPSDEYFFNEKGVEYFREELKTCPLNQKKFVKINLIEQLIKAGDTEEAIQELNQMLALVVNEKNEKFRFREYSNIRLSLALAYFRLGEQKNCILDHNLESCIYPIGPKAVYKIKEPTKEAIRLFTEALKDDSTNTTISWILNLAYMNLGYYPDSVPKKYFIPATALDSDYKIPKFTDMAPDLGLDINEVSGSVIMDDFDNDNDLDLFIYKKKPQYFVNNADGSFTDKTLEAGLEGLEGGRLSIPVQADYNNDGFLDIFIPRGGWQRQEKNYPPSSLLKNNGNGTFTDVTIEAGLLFFEPSFSATWADFDNDGWIDLFVSNQSQYSTNHPCKLFRNQGNGIFNDISSESGLKTIGDFKGVVCGDYDNDGFMDLYLLNPLGDNLLLKNNAERIKGKISFANVSLQANIKRPQRGISAFFIDYNNDGWLDIYAPAFPMITNFAILPSIIGEYFGMKCDSNLFPNLYENNRKGGFIDVAEKKGLNRASSAMGSNFGDIDNDGYKDVYLGTGALKFNYLMPNRLYRNNQGESFQDVTTSSGTGNLQKGHGIAFGDIDNDGDQDIYAVLGGGYSGDNYQNAFYINPGNENNWLKVKLIGVKSNKSAIGAKIKLLIQEKSGQREIYTNISSGGSFGASTLIAEIGLGTASKIVSMEITWPASKTKQIFNKVSMNTYYKIKENIKALEVVKAAPFVLKKRNEDIIIHHKDDNKN